MPIFLILKEQVTNHIHTLRFERERERDFALLFILWLWKDLWPKIGRWLSLLKNCFAIYFVAVDGSVA